MFDYSAGYNAVYTSDGPADPIPPREFVQRHPLYNAEEWYKGYDAGIKAVSDYKEGYQKGLAGERIDAKANSYRDGWYKGYRQFLRNLIKPIVRAAGKLNRVVVTHHYPDYDHCTGHQHEGGTKVKKLTRADLIETAIAGYMDRWALRDGLLPDTFEGVLETARCEMEGDGSFCNVQFMDRKEWKKIEAEKEFARMEKLAQEFSASCGHPPGTKQFILALRRAVRRVRDDRGSWNNPERRMEEWAAHQYCGGGSEGYFDDLNFENGRYSSRLDTLQEVWNYMERKFPLTMLRYAEAKRRFNQRES